MTRPRHSPRSAPRATPSLPTRVRALAWIAGASDLATGLLLLAVPALTLRLMRVPAVAYDSLVWLRWIGVFVAGVGALYFYPWLTDATGRAVRLRVVFEVTALVRAAVALFVLAAAMTGVLAPAWLPVALFDGGLAALQAAWLRTLPRPRTAW